MSAMRLGVNTLFYLPGEVGGSETYLLETLRALARRSDAPRLVLFTNAENEVTLRREFPMAEVVSIRVAATNRFARIPAEQLELPQQVKRAGVDVLWSPGYTAPWRCACPQVVSILDMQYKRFPHDVTWLAARTMDVLYPLAARSSAAVVTISEFAKSEIVHFLGTPAEKIEVTLLAADSSFAAPAPARPAAVGAEPYLLCVANTYPHKNIALLIRAFSRIATEIPHRLVLVGKARLGEPEVAAALARAPKGRVIRLAQVTREELITLNQRADWFVFPSLYEGFGLPVLEAMTAGAPVLTTREASLPEVAGDAARYGDGRDEVAFAAALREAIELPTDARAQLIAAGRARAGSFTWDASAAKLWRVLQRVAAGK
ncbi:MAG: glycosyltransferase family 4 protein [Kiritimatiellae bacterium]|nr:glycosyltransferase family 4 protein [Kiritimatiellia bacterium]MCO5044522.1 glycosyltransferase family 4 protein [Kiritimatiellia bacterium]MCO5061567.1 glycosyltransferase family 4 protein [Kiritimatiellia bacterium]MCO5067352.1 glycosyltransferase family 4 protein [Kiritimatiellia bacterium]